MFEILKWILATLLILSTGATENQYTVVSRAMEPALEDGQTVLVESIKAEEIQRFDIVLYENPDDRSELFVKRVIGLPGETLELRGGQTFINGELLSEPFDTVPQADNVHFGPVTIENDAYFVLGDNRPNSKDSRVIGLISAGLIHGKVKPIE